MGGLIPRAFECEEVVTGSVVTLSPLNPSGRRQMLPPTESRQPTELSQTARVHDHSWKHSKEDMQPPGRCRL